VAGLGTSLEVICIIGSVLLLIGMGHVETLFSERERAHSSQEKPARGIRNTVCAGNRDLVRTNEQLTREVCRLQEIQKTLMESEAQYRFLLSKIRSRCGSWIFAPDDF